MKGTVITSVRVHESDVDDAIRGLGAAHFDAAIDESFPRQAPDWVTIRASAHYGLANPDAEVQSQSHRRVYEVLDQLGIEHQSAALGVQVSGTAEDRDVLAIDSQSGQVLFRFRAYDKESALAQISRLQTLGVDLPPHELVWPDEWRNQPG